MRLTGAASQWKKRASGKDVEAIFGGGPLRPPRHPRHPVDVETEAELLRLIEETEVGIVHPGA